MQGAQRWEQPGLLGKDLAGSGLYPRGTAKLPESCMLSVLLPPLQVDDMESFLNAQGKFRLTSKCIKLFGRR